jgi:putative ABC transport system substrate-binding protein
VDRRAFIVGGVAAFAAPFPADAEQPKPPRIGSLLMGFAQAGLTSAFDAFRDGLREFGWIEDENIAVEYRWAGEDPQRLPELAAELVRLKVDIIIGSTPGVRAAQHATTRSTSRPPRPSASRSYWRGRIR